MTRADCKTPAQDTSAGLSLSSEPHGGLADRQVPLFHGIFRANTDRTFDRGEHGPRWFSRGILYAGRRINNTAAQPLCSDEETEAQRQQVGGHACPGSHGDDILRLWLPDNFSWWSSRVLGGGGGGQGGKVPTLCQPCDL